MARTAKTPRRASLNREVVIAAAIDLADRVGLDGLTMRTLASELDVVPMALYKHVDNKKDLLDGMIDVVFSEVTTPAIGKDWKKEVQKRCISMRDALTRHHWAVGMMENRINPGPASMKHHNAMMGCLREAGFRFRKSVHIYSALDSYTYGFALQQKTSAYQTPEESAQHINQQIETQIPEAFANEYPYLAEVAKELNKSGHDFSVEFKVGLKIILDGVDVMNEDWKKSVGKH